jgi:hypothetical protein
MQWVKLLVHP